MEIRELEQTGEEEMRNTSFHSPVHRSRQLFAGLFW